MGNKVDKNAPRGKIDSLRQIKTGYDAYWFIYNHPHQVEEDSRLPFRERIAGTGEKRNSQGWWEGQLINNLDIRFSKINPRTHRVDDNEELNTKVEVWLESGAAIYDEIQGKYIGNVHDILLDSGGPTFEEALINLAEKLLEKYGDYTDQTD